MKIYPKILFTTLPLVILSLLAAVGTTYYSSRNALTDLAETWLATRLSDAMQVATEHEEMLRKYGLETLPSSVKQAKFDTGAAMLSIEIGEQGYIFVVNSKGTIIVHPDEAMVGTDISTENWFRKIGKSRKGKVIYQLQSARHLSMYEYFQPWQWYIFATDPENEVYGAVNRMGPYVLILVTLGTLVMALALMIMTRRLTEPLRLLEAGAKKIGDGALETRIAVHTRDELGSLSDAFNRTAKQLQETLTALQNSEKHFRSIIENVSDIITILDGSGDIRYLSPSVEQVLGYRPEELVTKNVFDFIHPDDNTNAMNFFNQRISISEVAPPMEFRFLRKGGSWCMLEAIGNNLLDDPVVEGVIVYSRDITERKQAEAALRESEVRYRTVLETSPDPIVVYDIDGKVTYFNPAFTKVFGWTLEERLDKKMDIFVPDEDWPETRKMIDKVLAGEYFSGFETRRYSKKGNIIHVNMSAAIYKDQDGNPIGSVINLRDISEQKQLQDQLQQAQKMEAIGTLAGGVAHDLNNILSGLVSYPELLLMDIPEDSPLRKPILTIQDAGQKAAVIVQDLLTLARRGVAITEVVNLNDIVYDHLESPEHEKLKSFHRGVEFEINLAPDLLNILGSPVHLSKTIMNLLSNATEAMPEAGTITMSTSNQYLDRPVRGYEDVQEGDYVVLSVVDSGVGISEEDLARIFEPFYTKKAMGRSGTGLGMAVVWGTIKDHNGYIDIESTFGKGTRFDLYFPVTRREPVEKRAAVAINEFMGSERILVVDDIKQQREIASEILTKLGYSVATVSSGEEAVEYMKDNSADLLILDMIMDPGIDGLDTYKKILELHSSQKAIIASGYSKTERVEEAQKLGAGQYIKKPYTLEKIGVAVRDELKK